MKKTKAKHTEPAKSGRPEPTDAPADAEIPADRSESSSPSASDAGGARDRETDPVAELRAKVDSLEDALLRAKADYQNFQRRAAVERADAVRYANADIMRSVLGVLDDFERSLEAANSSDNLEAVVAGIKLVYDNLVQALRAHGLEKIDALHQPFDPNVHEALLQQQVADHPPGTVVEQVARGYRLHDRVLRPAKVIVAKEANGPAGDDGPAMNE